MDKEKQTEIVNQLKYFKKQAEEEYKNKVKQETSYPHNLSPDDILYAVLRADFGDAQECSEKFWFLYDKACEYNEIIRNRIRKALHNGELPLDTFDRYFLNMCLDVSSLYADYFKVWLEVVLDKKVTNFIEDQLANNREDFLRQVKERGFDNHYTVLVLKKGKERAESIDDIQHIPYYTYFAKQINPIISRFDTFLKETTTLNLSPEQKIVIDYISAYRDLLSETDINKLEEKGVHLDEIWMDNHYWIQVVHDVETDYADPLAVKIIPDFSVRFPDVNPDVDEKEFEVIKNVLVDYYKDRNTENTKRQIPSLSRSHASVCFIAFNTSQDQYFKFAGQSLPNRADVREKKGVKIYIDFEQSEKRFIQAKKLFFAVFRNAKEYEEYLSSIVSMVYHVVPHEFGHTTYNFSFFKDIDENVKRLEELRADLNAYYTVYKYYEDGKFTTEDLYKNTVTMTAFDLRRFSSWDSAALYPYKLSMLNAFNHFFAENLIIEDQDRFIIDLDVEKVSRVYQRLVQDLNNIHNYLDVSDNDSLQKFYDFVLSLQNDFKIQKILNIVKTFK